MCIFKLYSIRLFGYVSKWGLLNLFVKSFCIFSTLSPINQFISTFLMPPMFQTLIELVDKILMLPVTIGVVMCWERKM